ncbi:endoglucanase, partial [Tremellales sp. Uapishka_1]
MFRLISLPLLASSLASAQLTPSPAYSPPAAANGVAASNATYSQWATVLGNSLWFYDAQRSGSLEAGTYGNRVSWRNDSALQDGSDWNLDLTGGWYDAGDYIKATFPLTFTLHAISWGALTHGKGYGEASQTAYLDGTLRWGFDWLIKAHPQDDVLFAQVGSSVVDNAYWGGDQDIPDPRPAYPCNSSSPGTDLLASASAAFSIASMLYSTNATYLPTSSSSPPTSPSLSNATYSALLLSHATSLYLAANSTTPYSTFSDSIPAVASAYSSSSYADDLTLAALSLALATDDSSYYTDAYNSYVTNAITSKQSVWNWDSKYPAIYVMFAEASVARPNLAQGAGLDVNVTGWQTECENYFDAIVDEKLKRGALTKGGLLYYSGDSDEASLNPAMAAATLMLKYAPLASSSTKTETYNSYARDQIDYMLGNNPMSAVYLVGSHPNSPQNPYSGLASGGNDITDIRNSPPTEAHVLYGAMVGGPSQSDKFWDYRDDWVECEVALDYNAMVPTIASMMLLNSSSDPYYTTLQAGTYTVPSGQPCDAALPCSSSGLSKGDIAGIVIGVVVGVLLIAAALIWWRRDHIRRWWQRGYM